MFWVYLAWSLVLPKDEEIRPMKGQDLASHFVP